MITRIVTALVVLALFLPSLLWLPALGWSAVCAVLIAWAGWEWARLAGMGTIPAAIYAVVVAALGVAAQAAPAAEFAFYGLAALFWIVAAPCLLKAGP